MTLDGRARKGVNVTGFSGCRRVADSGSARLRRAPAERKVWANESWMREAGEKLPLMRSLVCLVPGLRPHIEADVSSSCTLLSYISMTFGLLTEVLNLQEHHHATAFFTIILVYT
jgi:hypothetical protein